MDAIRALCKLWCVAKSFVFEWSRGVELNFGVTLNAKIRGNMDSSLRLHSI